MFIPVQHSNDTAAASIEDAFRAFASPASELKDGNWSSLIGIITALIGNVLISFALNTQRYAHMRLGHEAEQREKASQERSHRRRAKSDYGTAQSIAAEERAKKNLPEDYDNDGVEDGMDERETDPLIPRVGIRGSTSTQGGMGKEEDSGETKTKSYLKSPYWWLGVILMTIGEAGNFLAYGFAPASIVSPLGVVALVANCLIAPIMLKERFRIRDGLGVIVAIAGAVVVVLSAKENSTKLGPDKIWEYITAWEFETYLGITIAMILVLLYASQKYGHKSIFIDLGLVGLFGGYTALSTKGVASLLSYTLWKALTFPIFYVLILILVGTAVMQIRYVNKALQNFNATQVIPTQFVLFTLSVIIGSAILYRDFEQESGDQAGKFVGGCLLTFFGVYLITGGRHEDDDEEDIAPETEQSINLVDEERQTESTKRQVSEVDHSRPQTIRRISFPRFEQQSPHNGSALGGPQTPQISITPQGDSSDPSYHDETPTPSWRLPLLTSAFSQRQQQPPLKSTSSAPVLPTLTQPAGSQPQSQRVVTDEAGLTASLSPDLSRTPSAQTPRPSMARHSIVSMMGGPLATPLSGSLSAVVADSLRRGVDVRRMSSIKRRPLSGVGVPAGTEGILRDASTKGRRRGNSEGDVLASAAAAVAEQSSSRPQQSRRRTGDSEERARTSHGER